jgi:Carbamoylphosphate synthase large subunit (split gene in MJ)
VDAESAYDRWEKSMITGTRMLFIGAVGGMSYATRLAKKKGIYVVVADYYRLSQAKEYADRSYLISTTDIESLKKIVEKESINAIFTGFSDNNIRSAEILCNYFGLPCYITGDQLNIVQNKLEFKKLCRKYDVPTPQEYYCCNPNEIHFPVIVKPSDSYASKGISVCKTTNDFKEACSLARSFSRNGEIVVEQYHVGEEVMVHYVMLNGILKITSVLERKKPASFYDGKNEIAPIVIENNSKYDTQVKKIEKNVEVMLKKLRNV